MIGGGQPVSEAVALLENSDAAMVLIDGKPAGVLTRQDLLAHLGALTTVQASGVASRTPCLPGLVEGFASG